MKGLLLSGLMLGAGLASAAPVTITFEQAMTGPNAKALDALVKVFEASHPNIHVRNISEGGYSSLNVKILAQIAAGSPPTLAQMYPSGATNFIQDGEMVPVAKFMSPHAALREELYPAMLASGRYPNGEIWLLPFNKSDIVLYYNKTLFDKLGLKPPTSWAALRKDAPLLTDPSAKRAMLADNFGNDTFQAFVNSTGSRVLTKGESDPVFATDGAGARVLSLWHQLVSKGQAVVTAHFDYEVLFGNGNAAVITASIAELPYIQKAVGHHFQLGVAPMPAGPTGQGKVYTKLYGSDIGIFAKGPNASPAQQSAAWAFASFLVSPKAQAYWVEHTGYLPANRMAYARLLQDGYFKTVAGRAKLVAIAELAHAVPTHFSGWWDQFAWRSGSPLPSLIQSAVKGDSTPEQAMAKALTDAQRLIRREGNWLAKVKVAYLKALAQ
jgi:multiple sugar transport system substrate-binding protein